MLPTLTEGEYLICRRLFFKKRCKPGKIYVIHLRDDEDGEPYYVIKRLEHRHDGNVVNTWYWFLGDNSRVSCDSRHYGYVNFKAVKYAVIKKLR